MTRHASVKNSSDLIYMLRFYFNTAREHLIAAKAASTEAALTKAKVQSHLGKKLLYDLQCIVFVITLYFDFE